MPFDRCYGCRHVWTADDMEGGLCPLCRGERMPEGVVEASSPGFNDLAAADLRATFDLGAERALEDEVEAIVDRALGSAYGPLFGGRA